jgi:oligoendopeptidase F
VSELPLRSEIEAAYQWDLTVVYPTDEAWRAAARALAAELEAVPRFHGHLGDSPAALADWLEHWQALRRELGILYVYASSQQAVDTTDQTAAANYGQAIALYAQTVAALSFAEPEMIAIGPDRLMQWAEQEARLAIYRHYFDALKSRQAHVRSSEVEELLGQVLDPFRTAADTHGVMADADLTFKPARSSATPPQELSVAQGTIDALLTSTDRETRRTAWESYADAHLAMRHSMANCLAAGVKQNVYMARARRYDSALEAALSANHIPVQVYHRVLETFRRNLPVWRRYWQVRRQALGVERLQTYDLRAPLILDGPAVPYGQAVAWICEGMAPLGSEYVEIMARGLRQEHWVDVYPNRGKTAGAFSSGTPGTSPLILMSFSDDVLSLSTLAHELGHSLHSYYTWRAQPFVYSDYSIFVAEVASNLNQALVREHLLARQPDRAFQIALIEESMANYFRYFFVMPTLARFELDIHQRVERGESLTTDSLSNLLADLFAEGYGGEVEMDRDRVGIIWAQFPAHLYANFYVYQYTTGIAAAHALAQRVLHNEPGAVQRYLDFLKAGDSLYPLDALRLAGIDMASPEPVQQAFDELAALIERLAALLGVE